MSEQLNVFLDGVLAGGLTRAPDGQVVFDYAPGGPATALSVSMPRSVRHHSSDVVMPWLDNLLPDSDDVRARWAASFGLRRVTPFDLLANMGADCAGAVQILPAGQAPDEVGGSVPASTAQIAAHLRTLRNDAAAWVFPGAGGRWSLAGQQGKFALAHGADGWSLPTGRTASTHIVKTGVAGLPGSDVAEFVTMRSAALLGLPVPQVDYTWFEDEPALVVSRFDRLPSDGAVRRVHQEDLCQALGLWRAMKYQADGGPSTTDIAALLRRVLDPRDKSRGLADFARVLVFNWLVAGTDAHAKNYALLHLGSRVALAPFYDLTSTALLWPAREIHYEGRLAMKFGGEYRLRKVDTGRYTHAAHDLGVDEQFLIDTARTYRDQLPDTVRDTIATLPGQPNTGTMLDAITARLTWSRVP